MPKTKKSTDFVNRKGLTLDDFEVVRPIEYVPWENIEKVLGKRDYKKFIAWMRGQTCVKQGAYPWDLKRFLRNQPIID